MSECPVWILTWKRPDCLNRLIRQLYNEGFTNINIMSNHPELLVEDDLISKNIINNAVINTLTEPESNSWCTRSWNSIALKAFKSGEECMFFQDDTTINPGFGDWFRSVSKKYDLLWGPAGDQWFYFTKTVFANAGYFDERFISCFCGDCDWLRRAYHRNDKSKLCIEDTHDWGIIHNPCGVRQFVNHGYGRRGSHLDNHWEAIKHGYLGRLVTYTEGLYYQKWGRKMQEKISESPSEPLIVEVDWYPWFTQDVLGETYINLYDERAKKFATDVGGEFLSNLNQKATPEVKEFLCKGC